MTNQPAVLTEHVGDVAVLTLNRPHALNALNVELLTGLVDALRSVALASGATIYEAALIGSVLAGIQVGRLGNVPIAQETVNSVLQL